MLVFYLGCLCLFLYHLYVYFLTGRVEVVTTTYKMDWVEKGVYLSIVETRTIYF